MAEALDAPLSTVAYHTRALVELGCLELVKTVPRRGALEHYRTVVAPWFRGNDRRQLPLRKRRQLIQTVLHIVLSEVAGAFQAGSFETRADLHVSRTPLQLDEAAWAELNAMLDAVLERAMELRAQPATCTSPARTPPEPDPGASALATVHKAPWPHGATPRSGAWTPV